MSNLKYLLINNFNIFIGRLKRNKANKNGTVFLGVVFIVALAYSFFMAYSLSLASLVELTPGLGVYNGIFSLIMIVLLFGFTKASNATSNDSDLLLSLPIKKKDIVISKLLSLYLFDFAVCFVVFFPTALFNYLLISNEIYTLIAGIIFIIIIPMISVSIELLFGIFLKKMFSNKKSSTIMKSVFTSLVIIVVLVFYMYYSFSFGTVTADNFDTYLTSSKLVYFIYLGIQEKKILNLFFIILVGLIMAFIAILVFSLDYGKQVKIYHSKDKSLSFDYSKSTVSLLTKKEITNYLSISSYFVNTIFGMILLVIASIAFLVFKDDIYAYLEIDNSFNNLLASISLFLFSFSISTASISASSISLESKYLWILKNNPIELKDIFKSKIFTNIIVCLPFTIISSILFIIALKLNVIISILLLLIPILNILLISIYGLIINLKHPLLDYDNEAKVVKQGLSVLLTMLLGFAFGLLAIIPVLINNILGFALLSLVYILLIILGMLKLKRKGKRLFDSL